MMTVGELRRRLDEIDDDKLVMVHDQKGTPLSIIAVQPDPFEHGPDSPIWLEAELY